MEKTSVMNNWTDRRCELPIIAAASFFKPESDPRSSSDFSKDNFEFCMKSTVEKFIAFFMGPVNALFGKQVNAAGDAINAANTVRSIAQTLYNTFMSYIDILFRKFNASVFEMSRVIQHLRMAMNRLSAIAVSMIYTGISVFRSMTNAIQLIIRVIFIICAIMLAIIIILWFILFPFIPIILATLGAIVTAVMVFSGVLSDSISADAQNKMGGFCFAEDTPIQTADGQTKPANEIQIGDELAHGGGRVITVIVMNGEKIPLYELNGIYVSGSHLVKGVDGVWTSVAEDNRSKCTTRISTKIYCFNTTSNTIPIQSEDGATIWFRDWEEIDNNDDNGQYMWNYMISTILNCHTTYKDWKHNMIPYCEDAVFGKDVRVKTKNGFVPISKLATDPFSHVVDRNGEEQDIVGIVHGEVEHAEEPTGQWHTDIYVLENGVWLKNKRTVLRGSTTIIGYTLITESGEFIVWDEKEKKEKVVRDFTEVGYQTIHETYPFVEARLRTRKNI
jgi:hypothetical protein